VLYERHSDLISVSQVMRDARARARAVQWLADEDLIDQDAARGFARDHPELKLHWSTGCERLTVRPGAARRYRQADGPIGTN
jgi:hypothetical protein